MKITLNLPPELNWLIPYYEQKAEVRAKLGVKSGIEQEFLTAIEQYALLGLRTDPDFSILLGTKGVLDGHETNPNLPEEA